MFRRTATIGRSIASDKIPGKSGPSASHRPAPVTRWASSLLTFILHECPLNDFINFSCWRDFRLTRISPNRVPAKNKLTQRRPIRRRLRGSNSGRGKPTPRRCGVQPKSLIHQVVPAISAILFAVQPIGSRLAALSSADKASRSDRLAVRFRRGSNFHRSLRHAGRR